MNAPFRWMKTKWIGFCRILFANARIFSLIMNIKWCRSRTDSGVPGRAKALNKNRKDVPLL